MKKTLSCKFGKVLGGTVGKTLGAEEGTEYGALLTDGLKLCFQDGGLLQPDQNRMDDFAI